MKRTLNDWFATRSALGALGAFSLIFLNDFAAIPPVPTVHTYMQLTCGGYDRSGQEDGTVYAVRIKACVVGINGKATRKDAVGQ
jgi:hypothetical protein